MNTKRKTNESELKNKKAIIVGAGLAGSLWAVYLAKKKDTGDTLCKINKNCNNKIQDITLDNFPNLKLKKD